ncbi:hypothetical protein [Stenotrophomonas sp. PS02289]|uniref:hypothetical protein n=1 Tax=Stenotrophomonas sp. PS02289 TaxID=2991422 RepID=UPI002499B98D|nr:hypothetical protein [Stenotrophomonas sp. PS02289]
MKNENQGYLQIRDGFLAYYYEYCRNVARSGREWRPGETAAGFALDQFDGVFYSDIENLMLEVIFLVSSAGRQLAEARERELGIAAELLGEVGVANIPMHMSEEEAAELLFDLKTLGLIPRR